MASPGPVYPIRPRFYLYLKDPSAYRKMLQALESCYRAEECQFRTIFGVFKGYRIFVNRDVAEKIEKQTELCCPTFQRGRPPRPAVHGRTGHLPLWRQRDESKFSPDFDAPLTSMEIQIVGDPTMPKEISHVEVLSGRRRRFEGSERQAMLDSVLKWMLVTCFGYTGYRNAKFGQIQVHETITGISRELLIQIKGLAEDMGFEVLHGIVDCLWVKGAPISKFKEAVERETGILTEVDSYDWIAFLPMADGNGAYNRYFGRLDTGKVKIRGIMARKGDAPEYVRRMQQELFDCLGEAKSREELARVEPKAQQIYSEYRDGLGECRCPVSSHPS